MKNILNVIADVLTLLAVCLAAVGHVLPWFNVSRLQFGQLWQPQEALWNFQAWHASRSGVALAILGLLVCVSLIANLGPMARRILNLAMFASAFIALLFELMIFSNAPAFVVNNIHLHQTEVGFALSMIPTCFAIFFSLVRMLWTMPPTRVTADRAASTPSPAELDLPPAPPKANAVLEPPLPIERRHGDTGIRTGM